MVAVLRAIAGVGIAAALAGAAAAQDKVRAAVGQRGNWDTLFISQGVEAGIFKRESIDVDITWTRGGAETLQAVITDSADVAVANGIPGVIGAIVKGAPVKIVSAKDATHPPRSYDRARVSFPERASRHCSRPLQ